MKEMRTTPTVWDKSSNMYKILEGRQGLLPHVCDKQRQLSCLIFMQTGLLPHTWD